MRWVLALGKGCPQRRGQGSRLCIPQCAVVTDVCFTTSKAHRCVNTNPGFHCLPCPPRYKGTQPFGVGLEAARTEKQVRKPALRALGKGCKSIGKSPGHWAEGGGEEQGRPPWGRRTAVGACPPPRLDQPGGGGAELSCKEPERPGVTAHGCLWARASCRCCSGASGKRLQREHRSESLDACPAPAGPAAPQGGPAPLRLSPTPTSDPPHEG